LLEKAWSKDIRGVPEAGDSAAKGCSSDRFIDQKLDYMHDNPCRGVWRLAASPVDYLHSSATFYLTGEQGIYPFTNSGELNDIDLTIKAIVRKNVE
jgi:hypothetical protein